jgi:hypothetical protein
MPTDIEIARRDEDQPALGPHVEGAQIGVVDLGDVTPVGMQRLVGAEDRGLGLGCAA